MVSKVVSDVVPISRQLGSSYHLIRIAALSGAAAVCLAAYGRHSMKDTAETKEYRHIYESANNMHFIHSVALLVTPITKRPLIVNHSTLFAFAPNSLITRFVLISFVDYIISDWFAFYHWNVVVQRHLLLQSYQKVKSRTCRPYSTSLGSIWWCLFDSRMAKHAPLGTYGSTSNKINSLHTLNYEWVAENKIGATRSKV